MCGSEDYIHAGVCVLVLSWFLNACFHGLLIMIIIGRFYVYFLFCFTAPDQMRTPYLVCIQIIGSGRQLSKIGSYQYLRMTSSRNGMPLSRWLFEGIDFVGFSDLCKVLLQWTFCLEYCWKQGIWRHEMLYS